MGNLGVDRMTPAVLKANVGLFVQHTFKTVPTYFHVQPLHLAVVVVRACRTICPVPNIALQLIWISATLGLNVDINIKL